MHDFLTKDPKKFWMHITLKRNPVTRIKIDGTEVTDSTRIATAFNDFFSSVFLRSNSTTESFQTKGFDLPDITISEAGIFSALLSLDTKKSAGPDEIPNAFLFRYAEWCSKFLFTIFSESLGRTEIPKDWKTANVKPIHKSGDKLSPSKYRPISLLCTCTKVLEHFIFSHISSFLETNHFFL